MARFYANENLSLGLVRVLRQFNHDILTSLEASNANQGIPDEEVLAYATANNRIVITFNRDDFINLHRCRINHSGIVICKTDRNYQAQGEAINQFFDGFGDNLDNKLIRVLKQNQVKSSSQIFVIRQY
jgi:predicted nuclease of predicted toxin-antitoxin system